MLVLTTFANCSFFVTMDSSSSSSHNESSGSVLQPVWLLSHGAGPCFFLEGGMFKDLDRHSRAAQQLRDLPKCLPHTPRAILVISGHMEERVPTIVGDTDAQVKLLYDYYGFPREAYSIHWPARGSTWLSRRVKDLLAPVYGHIETQNDRGFDHGVFVPLKLAFPEAQVPVVQLSLFSSLDSKSHVELGKLLAPLRQEGVLIVGSGSLTHNRNMGPVFPKEKEFVQWFDRVIKERPSERGEALGGAPKDAPHFQFVHPREEHWLPLVVAAAAGGSGEVKKVVDQWWMSLACVTYAVYDEKA